MFARRSHGVGDVTRGVFMSTKWPYFHRMRYDIFLGLLAQPLSDEEILLAVRAPEGTPVQDVGAGIEVLRLRGYMVVRPEHTFAARAAMVAGKVEGFPRVAEFLQSDTLREDSVHHFWVRDAMAHVLPGVKDLLYAPVYARLRAMEPAFVAMEGNITPILACCGGCVKRSVNSGRLPCPFRGLRTMPWPVFCTGARWKLDASWFSRSLLRTKSFCAKRFVLWVRPNLMLVGMLRFLCSTSIGEICGGLWGQKCQKHKIGAFRRACLRRVGDFLRTSRCAR